MASNGGLHGLDRKAMEEERLARIARKRQAEAAPDEPNKAQKIEDHKSSSAQAKPILASKISTIENLRARAAPKLPPQPKNLDLSNQSSRSTGLGVPLEFPHGAIRKTWCFGHARHRDIKIEEVLQKNDLKIAVLSSFQWDMDWIFSKLDMKQTKVHLIMQAKDAAIAQYRSEAVGWSSSIRLCFPPMPSQVWCMHSKLMLLFHQQYLRIVVPTANLVKYDWGETGVMENTVFLIDVPRLPETDQGLNNKTLTAFGDELIHFLNATGISDDVQRGVLKFDFSNTSRLGFVHTIGGTHLGSPEAFRTGYPILSQAVRNLDLVTRPGEHLEIDYVTSSIGSLNKDHLASLVKGVQGVQLDLEKNSKLKASKKKQPADPPDEGYRFRIYFPSYDTVAQSTGGQQNGGTICLQSKWYNAATFPRNNIRDCISRRKGLLSHNKIMLVRSPRRSWAFVGSHNISESAWGKLVIDRTTKQPKLNCRNWECGVIVPVKEEDIETESEDNGDDQKVDEKSSLKRVPTMKVFDSVLDLPFEWPGKEYGEGRPWLFMEQ